MTRRIPYSFAFLLSNAVLVVPAHAQGYSGQDPAPAQPAAQEEYEEEYYEEEYADENGVEVLTQGPIHEAYAAPVVFNAGSGPVVASRPPEDITEIPPDEMPEGDNVEWIPGYWSYSDEREDFLWVSGIWRLIPSEREWFPGYWAGTDEGWQWVPGYWGSVEEEETEYYSQPPKSLEAGPNTPAPSDNHQWVPGTWQANEQEFIPQGQQYQESQPSPQSFAWRPGFWMPARQDYEWIPSQWVWSPAGYTFVDGYWDSPFEDRGVMFAPLHVPSPFRTSAFSFGPSIMLQAPAVCQNFFFRPHTSHFYFGDYYAPQAVAFGYIPSFNFHMSRWGYDPGFAHAAVFRGPGFLSGHKSHFALMRSDPYSRPSKTYVKQVKKVKKVHNGDHVVVKGSKNVSISNGNVMAAPIQQVAQNSNSSGKRGFRKQDETQKSAARANASRVVELAKARGKTEDQVRKAAPSNAGPASKKVAKIPRSARPSSLAPASPSVAKGTSTPPRPSGDPGRKGSKGNFGGGGDSKKNNEGSKTKNSGETTKAPKTGSKNPFSPSGNGGNTSPGSPTKPKAGNPEFPGAPKPTPKPTPKADNPRPDNPKPNAPKLGGGFGGNGDGPSIPKGGDGSKPKKKGDLDDGTSGDGGKKDKADKKDKGDKKDKADKKDKKDKKGGQKKSKNDKRDKKKKGGR